MLGAQSHGDEATFAAKVRVIRYLHERLGFDVLAFESGLFDMTVVGDAVRAGEAVPIAVRRGLDPMWSESRQVQPLLPYVGAQVLGPRPLELAGFDTRFTGTSPTRFPNAFRAFLASQRIDTATIKRCPEFSPMLAALAARTYGSGMRASAEQQQLFFAVWDELMARLTKLGTKTPELAYWQRVLSSTRICAADMFAFDPTSAPSMSAISRRDRAMGANLLWLARQRYPTHKIIVWSANFHIMHNPALIDARGTISYNGLTTMGDVVAGALGDKSYAIAFLTSEGAHGLHGQRPIPVTPDTARLERLWCLHSAYDAELAHVALRRGKTHFILPRIAVGSNGGKPTSLQPR